MTAEGIEKWRHFHRLMQEHGANPSISMQGCARMAGCSRHRTTLYRELGWVKRTGNMTWEFTGPAELDQDQIEDMRIGMRKMKAGKKNTNPNPEGPIDVKRAARKVIFSSYGMARRFCVFLVEKGYIPPDMEKEKQYYGFKFGGGEPLRYTNSKEVFWRYSGNWLTTEEMDYLVDAYSCVPLKHAQLPWSV